MLDVLDEEIGLWNISNTYCNETKGDENSKRRIARKIARLVQLIIDGKVVEHAEHFKYLGEWNTKYWKCDMEKGKELGREDTFLQEKKILN